MEEDEALDPMDIGFFGLIAVMPRADRLPNLVEQLGFSTVAGAGVPVWPLSPPSITASARVLSSSPGSIVHPFAERKFYRQ